MIWILLTIIILIYKKPGALMTEKTGQTTEQRAVWGDKTGRG